MSASPPRRGELGTSTALGSWGGSPSRLVAASDQIGTNVIADKRTEPRTERRKGRR